MLADTWTVFWRESRQNLAQFADRRRLLLGFAITAIFFVGLELAFQIHEDLANANPVLLIWIGCWLPLGSAVTMATDTIAGERERHTLETLLATRLPDRAILTGKALAITLQSWLSAAGLAFGLLLALNAVTIWQGTLVTYPGEAIVTGALVSLLLTFLATLVAILLSMNATTVRQANIRVIIVTSVLPVALIIPVGIIVILGSVMIALVADLTGLSLEAVSRPSDGVLWAMLTTAALIGLGLAAGVVYGIAALRFNRARLMRTFTAESAAAGEDGATVEARMGAYDSSHPLTRRPLSYDVANHHARALETESIAGRVLRDALTVAWKETVEVRAQVREWRGWLVVALIVLLVMAVQASAIASWFWAQDDAFSLMFWVAMAAILPVMIAQRSADAVAGERERHTGEILFTTRLSDPGILIGKLAAVALLPWSVALVIPLLGLLTTNALHSARGSFIYPPDVAATGAALTLSVAMLFASGGMLLSIGAPTVQLAARRISWFLMPILIAPGLLFRGSMLNAVAAQNEAALNEGIAGAFGSGDAMRVIWMALPVLALINTGFVLVLWRRFARGKVVFD